MEIIDKIQKLKKEKNAIILVHNYQLPEIHDIADYIGDSLGLSIEAAKTKADVIVFCGVYFMAETAKILSPEKIVLIPEKSAGCPMADMITADQLRTLKAQHPGATVMCYVNTTADVKAECDLCCTSANAVRMAGEVLRDEKEIIFVPDQYLAAYTAKQTGRNFIVWKGYCPIHASILPDHIREQRNLHPEADVIVHPECTPEVIEAADRALSTEGMIRYAKESEKKEFIIGTEIGILYRLRKECPGKIFYPASDQAVCQNMKLTTLEKVCLALENMSHEVIVPEEVRVKAKTCIERMLRS
jgi:quinolinate synthase